jgi:hypothetical protein
MHTAISVRKAIAIKLKQNINGQGVSALPILPVFIQPGHIEANNFLSPSFINVNSWSVH